MLLLKKEVIGMSITTNDIEYVAKLARLNLTEEEKIKLTHDMQGIIGFVDKLNELDTTGIQPTDHVLPIHNVFREDEVRPSMDRDKLLQNAPKQKNGAFLVPKVVD